MGKWIVGVGRIAGLVGLLGIAACGGSEAPEATRPDIVFLLVDTLRRDHLGAYGYEAGTTPFLDALAVQGTVFERAVAQAPWTGASMASLWTSRYPSEVGGLALPGPDGLSELGRTPIASLRKDAPTLAERLRDAGYDTRAFVANAYAGRALGLLRGFEVAVDEPHAARPLVDAALKSLATAPGASPLFLYLHFRDVHEPTWPPEPYRLEFAREGEALERAAAGWRHGDAKDPSTPEVQSFRRQKLALYDASLYYVDREIGRLAQGLVQLRRDRPFVFVLASDHGEAFWEHADLDRRLNRDPRGLAGVGHGHSLFGEATDVPLILSGAGVPRGRDPRPVRNVDVMPTLLGLAGAVVPDEARGVDLLRPRSGEATPGIAFSENIAYGAEARSLEAEGFKLIRYASLAGAPTELLFDRGLDPDEQRDVRAEQPERARRLGAQLDALVSELAEGAPGPQVQLDARTRSELQALGYAQ